MLDSWRVRWPSALGAAGMVVYALAPTGRMFLLGVS
jgi:hypothetical protein